MKKKHLLGLFFSFALLTIILMSYIFYTVNKSFKNIEQNLELIVPDQIPKYHFVMLSEDMEILSWDSVKKGVEKASKDFNVAIEYKNPNISKKGDHYKHMDMAITSKVDGIVTYVCEEEPTKEYINKAVNKGIPVVTMGADIKDSNRKAFVGINSFDIGSKLGNILISSNNDQGEAVLIISDKMIGGIKSKDILLSGIKNSLKNHPYIHVTPIEYNTLNYMGIEDVIKDILNSKPNIETIICTTERDTLVAAQVLIDLNKVEYNIIGIGNSKEILDYIKKSIIFSTVQTDMEQMGYLTIRALIDIKEKAKTVNHITVNSKIITKDNVSKIIKDGEK